MPRKFSLRGFLRQDILSRRSKALLPLNSKNTSGLKREAGAVLSLNNRAKSKSPPPEDDEGKREVDSIFGEPIYTRTEIQQQKLEQFLEEDQKDQPHTKTNRNATLDKLREELDTIVKRELEASPEERVGIRRAKSQLIVEIGKLEARNRIERVRGHKGMSFLGQGNLNLRPINFRRSCLLTISIASSDEVARLPEPIGLAEKKRLQLAKARVTKAVLGLEVCHSAPLPLTSTLLKYNREAVRSESARMTSTSSMGRIGFELE